MHIIQLIEKHTQKMKKIKLKKNGNKTHGCPFQAINNVI